jgi:hypothetical protein
MMIMSAHDSVGLKEELYKEGRFYDMCSAA